MPSTLSPDAKVLSPHGDSGGYQLTVAPNGARRTRADHPALPMTADELAQTARACQIAGATGIHLHVRDGAGVHSLDPGRYREAIAAITERAPGMRIQITTEAAGLYDVDTQLACLDQLRPAAASVSVREMARDPALAAQLYALADEASTQVQHILYDPSCVAQYQDWRAKGVIRPSQDDVIFVLGQYAPPVAAKPSDLSPFLTALDPAPGSWTTCAFGRTEIACLLATIERGGHVRIGFENNLVTAAGKVLPDNAASVRALVAAASAQGHHPATFPPDLAA